MTYVLEVNDTELSLYRDAALEYHAPAIAVVRPGDEVIVFDPAYDSSAPAVALAGGSTKHVPWALAAAGLSGDQVLRAAGANIGKTLGLANQLGVVQPGAFADLVLVAGDPLTNVADTLRIVAVVRNGRFYSLAGLLDPTEKLSAAPH